MLATKLKYDWQICGHQDLLKRLEAELDQLPHAMLLAGTSEIGKMTIFKRLAQILQTDDLSSKIALEIEEETHLDTMIIHDDGAPIKIAEVRKIKDYMQLSRQGNFKITIVQNVERLTIPAANSLLKILEEPPANAKFFLTTSNLGLVLPTIVSRCRVYRTALGSDWGEFAPKESSRYAAGQLGRAIKLSADPEKLAQVEEWSKMIDVITGKADLVELMQVAETLNELERSEVLDFLKQLLWVAREQKRSAEVLEKIQETINLISQNVNTRLALEVLFLQCFTHLV